MCVCVFSLLDVSDSLWHHRLQPARLLCSYNSPGKNTGVGNHALIQGIFLTWGLKLCLLHLLQKQVDSLPLSHRGSPRWDSNTHQRWPVCLASLVSTVSSRKCWPRGISRYLGLLYYSKQQVAQGSPWHGTVHQCPFPDSPRTTQQPFSAYHHRRGEGLRLFLMRCPSDVRDLRGYYEKALRQRHR